ncbi:GTPase Era [Patescibacteria group bacterium]|nr:GTPase Era [Patescibacteria group bacterium]
MKSGFVVLAGRSNVGKSTLLNNLIGSKVAIVTPKPQTTRLPIRGVLHEDKGQIVFVDTPGIFLGKKDTLTKKLNQSVKDSMEGIDAIVYVVDPTRKPGKEELHAQKILKATNKPIVLVINKSDLAANAPYIDELSEIDVGQVSTLLVSALNHRNLNILKETLFELMPEGEGFYPDMQITDMGHQQWIEEVIREKVFLNLEQELPYTVHVSVEQVKFRSNGGRCIEATIWTTNDRYKRMIIGAKGATIKKIGIAARKELTIALNTDIHLQTEVKVDARWQEKFGNN